MINQGGEGWLLAGVGGVGQGVLMDFEEAALREMARFTIHC